jgi:hypothetical protein
MGNTSMMTTLMLPLLHMHVAVVSEREREIFSNHS